MTRSLSQRSIDFELATTNVDSNTQSRATGHELEELEIYLTRAGIDLDPSLRYPKWDGTRMDLDDALSWILIGERTQCCAE